MIRCAPCLAVLGILLVLPEAGCARRGGAGSELPEIPREFPGYIALLLARSSGPHGSRRARIGAAYLAPGRVRLEVLDPGGSSRAVLVAAPAGALQLDPPRRAYRSFPGGREALVALLGFAAPPEILARLLLGPSAARAGLRCLGSDSRSAGESGLTCSLPDGGELRFPDSEPARAEIRSAEGESILVSWEGPPGGDAGVPRATEFRVAARSVALRLEIRELRFTAPEEPLFSVQPPEGFQSDVP